MTSEPPGGSSSPTQGPSPSRQSAFRRLLPLLLALGAAVLVGRIISPSAIDLLLVLPAGYEGLQRLEIVVRKVDENGLAGPIVLRAQRGKAPQTRTVVLTTRLRRGAYLVDGYPVNDDALAPVEGTFEQRGEEVLEVVLSRRP